MHPYMFNKMKMMAEGMGTAGGQQAGGAQGGQGANGQQGQQQPTEENNTDGFDLDAANIWETKTSPNQNGGGNGQNNQQVQQIQQPTAGDFGKYVEGLNFEFGMPADDIAKFVQSGDVSGMANALQQHGRQVYKQALTDSVKITQNIVDAAVQKAVKASGLNYQTDQSVQKLEAAMPIAKNPNVARMAQAVMGSFMKKGDSTEAAIENTKKFFAAVRGKPNQDFGLPPRSSNSNSRGQKSVDTGDEPETDWMEFAGLK